MSHGLLAVLWVAAAAALAACSSAGTLSRYTHETPAAAQQAGMYLDGTGPAAEAVEQEETRRQARRPASVAASEAVRADVSSARTTGSRSQARSEPPKPYTEEWWEREKREDARLKQKMNICRGC